MRFSLLAIAASLVAAVSAQQAFITAPVAETVWKSGSPATVSWNVNKTSAAGLALAVDLFKGDPTKQTEVAKLGTAPVNANKFAVTVPAGLASDYYSVRIGDSWSHYFVIQGTGALPSGGPPTAGVPAPTAVVPTTVSTASIPAQKTTTTAAPLPTSGASYLSAAPMAMAAAAVLAAALAL